MTGSKNEIIALKSATIEAGTKILLEDASFSFGSECRMAIVGANGAGKSTLLKALANLVEPLKGNVHYLKRAIIEYVPQFVPEKLLSKTPIEALTEHIEARRPSVEEWQAYRILSQLRLKPDAFDRPLGSLSGGEANRVMLGRALVVEPDFLLLDEPTNHLDIEATVQFERMLHEELKVPFCVVSHDRQILDSCTTQTLFIRDKRLYFFGLPYSQATVALAEFDESQAQKRKEEEKEIQRLQLAANRMQAWVKTNSDLAPRYQRLKRRAEEIRENRTVITKGNPGKLVLSEVETKAKALVRVPKFDVRIPNGETLIRIEGLSIAPGERIAVIGRNGVGKSTFLKALVNARKSDSESIRFNPQTKIGYFDQELATLPLDKNPVDYLGSILQVNGERIHRALITAGIPYDRHKDLLKDFSGGERARVAFVGLNLAEPNFLILDEPTNHIDVDGIEDLEDQILSSGAAVVMVSHDRRFVEEVAQRFFIIRDKKLQEVSNIDDYYDEVLRAEDLSSESPKTPKKPSDKKAVTKKDNKEDTNPYSILERILELEGRLQSGLENDRDTPALKALIDELYQRLDE
jgi:ATP-binding cassette subfamily F protein 3